MDDFFQQLSIWIIPILLGIIIHEVAHGWVAYKLGDSTAKDMGKLTLNPLSHIDPIGTVLVPAILFTVSNFIFFGYAKPVPVNSLNLKRPRRDMVLVAAAGPYANIFLAIVSALLYKVLFAFPIFGVIITRPILHMAIKSIIVNVGLAVFNLLPVPPLDGGRVLMALVPEKLTKILRTLEHYGIGILVVLVLVFSKGAILGMAPVLYLLLDFLDLFLDFLQWE